MFLRLMPAAGIERQVWLERPERQRVQHHPDVGLAAARPGRGEELADLTDDGAALLVVRGVDVEEARLLALRLDLAADLIGLGLAGLAVEMDPCDVIAPGGESQRGGLAEAAAGAQDERPRLAVVDHAAVSSVFMVSS